MGFLFAKPQSIDHPFFGKLLFLEIKKKPENSAFEGSRHFRPTDKEIEFHLEGQMPGPTDRQIKFFQDLEDDWDSILHKVKPMIEEEFQNWKPDFKIADFKAEFVPTFLNIPTLEKKNYEWELTS